MPTFQIGSEAAATNILQATKPIKGCGEDPNSAIPRATWGQLCVAKDRKRNFCSQEVLIAGSLNRQMILTRAFHMQLSGLSTYCTTDRLSESFRDCSKGIEARKATTQASSFSAFWQNAFPPISGEKAQQESSGLVCGLACLLRLSGR